MESVTRGLQTVARRSGSHGDSLSCVCGNTGVPQKRPTARDVEASPSLRRDLLSFGSAFGEPVIAPHVAHTWPLGWTVGSIGGDALSDGGAGGTHQERASGEGEAAQAPTIWATNQLRRGRSPHVQRVSGDRPPEILDFLTS